MGDHGERGSASQYGVRGPCPQWGLGAKSLVSGSGAKPPPPETDDISDYKHLFYIEECTLLVKTCIFAQLRM